MSSILIVEDDVSLALSLADYLRAEGFQVQVAHQLREASPLITNASLVVLDWMLPDGQGIDFLRTTRALHPLLPIIFLTAKSDLLDKVLGLESGANDYMTKPFELRELLARIRGLLRRPAETQNLALFENICIDHVSREVRVDTRVIETTRKEFDLLALMVATPTKVFSREELLNKVWGFEHFPTTRTVDTHVLQLRQKISDDLIQTVRGIGYRLRASKEFT